MIKYGEDNNGISFTPAALTRYFRKLIGSNDVRIVTTRHQDVHLNQVVIGGSYDYTEDKHNFSSITIFVTYSLTQDVIKLADLNWKHTCVMLIECLGHELVHQRQYRERDFLTRKIVKSAQTEDQEYLGNQDEVEAYGYSIAIELFLLGEKRLMKSQMFKIYLMNFESHHPVIQQLISYISYYSVDILHALKDGDSYCAQA